MRTKPERNDIGHSTMNNGGMRPGCDLAREMSAAMCGFYSVAADALMSMGVAESALDQWPGPIGFACIETSTATPIFDFAEAGPRAFILPVRCGRASGVIVDLVAWFADRPDQWWSRYYTGEPLGLGQLNSAEIEQTPLMLRATPLDWLRAGGDGVCILDWKMSATSLRGVPRLICEDVDHGLEVSRRLSRPAQKMPEIEVLNRRAA